MCVKPLLALIHLHSYSLLVVYHATFKGHFHTMFELTITHQSYCA